MTFPIYGKIKFMVQTTNQYNNGVAEYTFRKIKSCHVQFNDSKERRDYIYGILTMMINSTVYFIRSHPTFIICPYLSHPPVMCARIPIFNILYKHPLQTSFTNILYKHPLQTSFTNILYKHHPIPSRIPSPPVIFHITGLFTKLLHLGDFPSASRACSSWSPKSGNDPRRPSRASRRRRNAGVPIGGSMWHKLCVLPWFLPGKTEDLTKSNMENTHGIMVLRKLQDVELVLMYPAIPSGNDCYSSRTGKWPLK